MTLLSARMWYKEIVTLLVLALLGMIAFHWNPMRNKSIPTWEAHRAAAEIDTVRANVDTVKWRVEHIEEWMRRCDSLLPDLLPATSPDDSGQIGGVSEEDRLNRAVGSGPLGALGPSANTPVHRGR